MPGQKYDKDPIIHIKENSVSTYVYAVVNDMLSTPKCYAENAPTIADQMIANGWKTLDFAPPEGLSGIVWFKEEPVEKSSTVTDVKTFETFSLKPELSQEDILTLDKAIVGVTGLLIQAEGFDSAKHAYRTVYGNTQPEVADDITVTFEYNGGQPTTNTTSQIRVRRGFAFGTGSDRLPVLTRVGYTFDKWYANQECTIPFDLTTKIGHNTILYAG